MTMTNWGQDIAGLDATEDEYAKDVQTLQKGVALYNYRVDVVKNKQAWLQLFNVVNQGLMTVSAALSASDENFKKLQTAVGSNETQQAIEQKYQNTGVQYTELVGLATSAFAFWAVDKWLTDARVWLNDIAEEAVTNTSAIGASSAVLGIDGLEALVNSPMLCIKLLFAPLRLLGSGVIETYNSAAESLGWTTWDECSNIQVVYDKLGIKMQRSWYSLRNDAVSYGEKLYSDGSQFKTAVSNAFESSAATGDGITIDSLTESLLKAGGSGLDVAANDATLDLGTISVESAVSEGDNLESEISDASEATEEATSWISSKWMAGLSVVGLIGADVLIGYWQGEVEKGKYQDAIDSLNVKIDSINDTATSLDSANSTLNTQIAAMCTAFAETYNALAYMQTPVVTLDTDTSIIDNAQWDTQLNLTDSQIDDLVDGTYDDPYNWSSPTDSTVNPYCITIAPFSSYILAAQGALQQFAELCNFKNELINYITNEQAANATVSLSTFWTSALMFSSGGGVIGSGDTAINMNDAQTQRWVTNLFAITSDSISEVLAEDANTDWLIADFDEQNTITSAA